MNLKSFFNRLRSLTQSGEVIWEEMAELLEYRTFHESKWIVITKSSSFLVECKILNEDGDYDIRVKSDSMECGNEISLLFDEILKNRDIDNKKRSVSCYKLLSHILGGKGEMPSYVFHENDVIKVSESIVHYIEPLFSQQPTSMGYTPLDNSQVVLISAPGATGKSALCDYLSSKKSIPVINLAKPVAMGAHSVTGLLSDNLDFDDFFAFQKGLFQGTHCLLIDAVDEGYARTGQMAFEGFLDDIAKIAGKSKDLSFIVLGRTSSLEFTALYLEEKDIRVTMLQIEPFTIEKAKEFIDSHLYNSQTAQRFESDYKNVRDYIINEIGGFFKDENELNHRLYQRFIGYAPVLLSISALLKANQNYNSLLAELQQKHEKHISLVIEIIEMLLLRDRDKIKEQLESLLGQYPNDFKQDVLGRAYSKEEQCERIFYSLIKREYHVKISEDFGFNQRYEEASNKWFAEHPFMISGSQVQNKVFESYVLAYLSQNNESLIEEICDYIAHNHGNSYLFFDLCCALHAKDSLLDYRLLPALIDSYKMTDRPDKKGIIEIDGEEMPADKQAKCLITFSRDDSEEFPFSFVVREGQSVLLPSVVSHLFIDAPIAIQVTTPFFEIGAPSRIYCNSFDISSQSVLFSASGMQKIIINAESFNVTGIESVPTISNPGNVDCKIFTNTDLSYPYIQYRYRFISPVGEEELQEKYQKLRRILLQFRSHKKGNLGRLREKIDNLIGRTSEIGERVLKAMKESGMIYPEGKMYIINADRVNEVLGLSYDDVLMCQSNEKVKSFLSSI